MRILPPQQREAMFEIYAFCRAVDDIADSDDPRPVRHAQLARWRLDVDQLFSNTPPLPLRLGDIRRRCVFRDDAERLRTNDASS